MCNSAGRLSLKGLHVAFAASSKTGSHLDGKVSSKVSHFDSKVATKVKHFDGKASTKVKHFDAEVSQKGKETLAFLQILFRKGNAANF